MHVVALVILTILFWGMGSFLGKAALNGLTPQQAYFWEVLGVLIVAGLMALFFRKEFGLAFQQFSWPGLFFGILYGLGTVTFLFALKLKPVTVISPAVVLHPAFTCALAVIFLSETITLKTGAGIVMAIVSAFLLLS